MSQVHDIFRLKKVRGKSRGIKNVGVTKYKVIDDDFVEGVTATEDGRVVAVIIRRGSLELPSPSKAVVNTSPPPRIQGLSNAAYA